MRLYPLTDAGAVDDPQHGRFEVQEHGGFDFPDELSTRLHSSRPGGRVHWETETERAERLHGVESARRRDPESLYSAVEDIAGMFRRMAAFQPGTGNAEVDSLNKKIAELEARLEAAGRPEAQSATAAPATPAKTAAKAAADK